MLLRGGSLFGGLDQGSVNTGKNTTLGKHGLAEELRKLLISLQTQSQVTGADASLLVVAGSVASQLEDLGNEILKDGSQVHRGSRAHASRIAALLQVTNMELQTSLR